MFESDPRKASANETKHEVPFEEASTAFVDPNGLDGEDVEHSSGEHRLLRLGQSGLGRILVIAYT